MGRGGGQQGRWVRDIKEREGKFDKETWKKWWELREVKYWLELMTDRARWDYGERARTGRKRRCELCGKVRKSHCPVRRGLREHG